MASGMMAQPAAGREAHLNDAIPLRTAAVVQRYIQSSGTGRMGGTRYYRRFDPKSSAAVAQVVLVHGFGQYSGKLLDMAQTFIDGHCIVHQIDLCGHGYSGGTRGDGKIKVLVDDVRLGHEMALQHSDDLPIFICGHSLGALLVLCYAIGMFGPMNGPCAGIVSMSAWLRLAPGIQPPWWKRMLLNTVGLALSEFLITSNVDPCKLAGNESSVDLLHDRLVIPFLTVAFARESVNHSLRCLLEANNFPETLPLLMIHGSADCLTDPNGSRTFLERSRKKRKIARHTLKLFPEGTHELHTNPETREELKNVVTTFVIELASKWDRVDEAYQHELAVRQAAEPRHGGGFPMMLLEAVEWLLWALVLGVLSVFLLVVPPGRCREWLKTRAAQL